MSTGGEPTPQRAPVADRRTILLAAGGAGVLAVGGCAMGGGSLAAVTQEKTVAYELPPLRHGYGALEPAMSAETLRIHHDVVHRAYLDAINAAIAPYPQLAGQSVEDLLRGLDTVPEAIRDTVREQAGGHANHQFLWKVLGPNGGIPEGPLRAQIDADFGSVEAMKAGFKKEALRISGSGWAFLVVDPDSRRLGVMVLPNNDSVLLHKRPGLLVCDLWEHAYFDRYQNRRAEWLDAFWSIVDWRVVGERLQGIREGRKQL